LPLAAIGPAPPVPWSAAGPGPACLRARFRAREDRRTLADARISESGGDAA